MNVKETIRIALFLAFAALVAGCSGSRPVPDWTYVAYNRLEDFKQAALEGRTSVAELHFQRATEEIKKSGDLSLLGKAYLTRYAVRVALLESFDDGEFHRIQAVAPDQENAAFLAFLKGDLRRADGDLLPAPYAAIRNDILEGKGRLDARIKTLLIRDLRATPDDLTRLILVGRLVAAGYEAEEILQEALEIASRQGWKKALLAYLYRLQGLYESNREHCKSRMIGEKIKLLQ